VAADSQLAKAHPDWLVTTDAGQPLVDPRLNRAYHVLDPTHPSAAEFLTDVFTALRKDGFTYFKLDFLYGAAYEGRRHDPEVTGTQALRLGLNGIFDAVNPPGKPEEAFVLACGAPLLPVVGLVHGATGGWGRGGGSPRSNCASRSTLARPPTQNSVGASCGEHRRSAIPPPIVRVDVPAHQAQSVLGRDLLRPPRRAAPRSPP